jgi:hypothetical protein
MAAFRTERDFNLFHFESPSLAEFPHFSPAATARGYIAALARRGGLGHLNNATTVGIRTLVTFTFLQHANLHWN